MRASLVEFMRTGQLGELKRGLRPPDVVECLGPPVDHTEMEHGGDHWHYTDSAVVYFFDGVLETVFLYWCYHPGLQIPASMELCGPTFTPDSTIEDVCAVLDQEKVPYELEAHPYTPRILDLRTGTRPNRVGVIFDSTTRKLTEMVTIGDME